MRFALAALVAVILGCASGPGSYTLARPSAAQSERAAIHYQVALPTVRLQTLGGGAGSGVVLFQDRHCAYIVTACHVILDEFGEVEKVAAMRHDQFRDKLEAVDASVIRWNKHLDLAVLKTAPVWGASARLVTPSDYSEYGLYSRVAAYGHSMGFLDGVFTEGHITDLDHSGWMLVTAPMTFGNSGCGVWTQIRGNWTLIGIEQAGYVTPCGSSISFLGLACRSDVLLKFLKGIPQ